MKPTVKPCAFGYVRVSVDEEAGNNASISAQADAIRAYAEREGIDVVQVFEEHGVSGRKLQRREFDEMIRLATSPDHPVQSIIVYSLSRFARRLLTQITAEHRLTEAGVRLVSLTEAFGEDATGKMMRSIVGVINEKYANDASLFTRRDRRGNARSGFWNGGPVPFGYETRTVRVDGKKERRQLFEVEEQARVVRLIFDLAETGLDGQAMGTRSLAAYLNANGYTLHGKRFTHGNLDGILNREHYAGSYLDRTADDAGVRPLDENAIVVPCPCIIEPEQIARVAARRAKAAPRVTAPRITNGPTLLTGLVTCAVDACGAGLTIRTGKGGRYSYYTCNSKATTGARSCGSKAMRMEELDTVVTNALLRRVLRPDRLRTLLADVLERSDAADERRRTDLDRVRRERIAAEAGMRRLLDLVECGAMSARYDLFAGKLSEAKDRITAMRAAERSLDGQLASGKRRVDSNAVNKLSALITERMATDTAFRRAYTRLFIDAIHVSNDRIEITGSKAALEAAVEIGSKALPKAVPSFDREWCRLQDSNL